MKTICPHCKQEYPETPDEYLGMTLQCSVCQKEFVCNSQAIKLHKIDNDVSSWAIGGYIALLVALFIGLSGFLIPLALFCGIMAMRKGDKFNGKICTLASGVGLFFIVTIIMGVDLGVSLSTKSILHGISEFISTGASIIFYILVFFILAAHVALCTFILFTMVAAIRKIVNMTKVSMYINLLLVLIATGALIFNNSLRILFVYVLIMGCCNAWKISKILKGISTSLDVFHEVNLIAYGVLCSSCITYLLWRIVYSSFDKDTSMWVGIPTMLAFIPVPFAIFCLLLDRNLGFKKAWDSAEQNNDEK